MQCFLEAKKERKCKIMQHVTCHILKITQCSALKLCAKVYYDIKPLTIISFSV